VATRFLEESDRSKKGRMLSIEQHASSSASPLGREDRQPDLELDSAASRDGENGC
jgi:hypothetical protein